MILIPMFRNLLWKDNKPRKKQKRKLLVLRVFILSWILDTFFVLKLLRVSFTCGGLLGIQVGEKRDGICGKVLRRPVGLN